MIGSLALDDLVDGGVCARLLDGLLEGEGRINPRVLHQAMPLHDRWTQSPTPLPSFLPPLKACRGSLVVLVHARTSALSVESSTRSAGADSPHSR